MAKLLVIDNYDSFTYNLVQMFMHYGLDLEIYRNDKISIGDIKNRNIVNLPDYILIGPGPKAPMHAGVSESFIKAFFTNIPILGICLGMQCINEFFGGQTIRSDAPKHGKTSNIYHTGNGLFKGIPSPFKAARYHSLIAKFLGEHNAPQEKPLVIDAWSSDGIIMSLSHISLPLHGLQFHPESFLTDYGFTLIRNFLKLGPMKNQL